MRDLPANAPSACPACGGRWTVGYTTKNRRNLVSKRGTGISVLFLFCNNKGCRLGEFIGWELAPDEQKQLNYYDRDHRNKRKRTKR